MRRGLRPALRAAAITNASAKPTNVSLGRYGLPAMLETRACPCSGAIHVRRVEFGTRKYLDASKTVKRGHVTRGSSLAKRYVVRVGIGSSYGGVVRRDSRLIRHGHSLSSVIFRTQHSAVSPQPSR